jgi:hypothetical protein
MDPPSLFTHDDYTVACICPMGVELAPVEAMLDEEHPSLPTSRDKNSYTLKEIVNDRSDEEAPSQSTKPLQTGAPDDTVVQSAQEQSKPAAPDSDEELPSSADIYEVPDSDTESYAQDSSQSHDLVHAVTETLDPTVLTPRQDFEERSSTFATGMVLTCLTTLEGRYVP